MSHTYTWGQHYGLDRFDLSGSHGFPSGGIGWITRNPSEPVDGDEVVVTRGYMGYITSMKNIEPPSSKWHWRVWWHTWTDGKLVIHTDEIRHPKRALAMKALEGTFCIDACNVKEIKWSGNLSSYE